MEDEILLHIKENRTIQLDIREKGIISTKEISLDTLLDCIKSSIQGVKISTGLLPERTLSVSISGDDSGKRYVVMEFPDEYADITYTMTTYEHFPLPRLLFGFTVESSGRISVVKMGVPAMGKLSPDTPMYCYPFSNVSRFNLCTGANSLPHIKSLSQLTNVPRYILSLPDNDDRYTDRNNKLNLGHRDLMEHLRDKDRAHYYSDILVPMLHTTLKDFI